jgi:hypothetical protein
LRFTATADLNRLRSMLPTYKTFDNSFVQRVI